MRPPKRDPSFLYMAGIAAFGGTLAIVIAIGLPLWSRYHGGNVSPVFSLFAAWGVAALIGAVASVRTYFDSGDPGRPPRGGVRLTVVPQARSARSATTEIGASKKRAA